MLRTFDSMLSEGVTNEMVKAGIDLQTHMSVSVTLGYSLNSHLVIGIQFLLTMSNEYIGQQVMRIKKISK